MDGLLTRCSPQGIDLSGYPEPVLQTESWRIGDHLLFLSEWIGRPSGPPESLGLMQRTEPRAVTEPRGSPFEL